MREINFRVWNVDSFIFSYKMSDGCFGDCWMDNDNLEQFTGVRDKKGKDIYEGDKLKVGFHYEGDFEVEEYIGVVVFEDGAYFIDSLADNIGDELDSSAVNNFNITIVGNIHENKKL